jgi:hypothetical protein
MEIERHMTHALPYNVRHPSDDGTVIGGVPGGIGVPMTR